MLGTTDLIHLPYTPDLTQAGVAYCCRWLTHPAESQAMKDFSSMRSMVAQAAVELALERYMREEKVPFSLQETNPFSDPGRVRIALGGRWCLVCNNLVSRKDYVRQLGRDPTYLLTRSLEIPIDRLFTDLFSQNDLLIHAFYITRPLTTRSSIDHYFIHPLPASWSSPPSLRPPGRLAVKSNLSQTITIELGGLGEDRGFQSENIRLPANSRVETQQDYLSVSYVHASSLPGGLIGIYSSNQDRSYRLQPKGWGNIWLDGLEIILAGYLELGEAQRRFQAERFVRCSEVRESATPPNTIPVPELRSLKTLFKTVRDWSQEKG